MAIAELKFITEEEYLAQEEAAECKHEYFMGQIYAMAGGSPEHALLISNTVQILGAQARPHGCIVYSSDLLIKVESTGLNTHSDAALICGELRRTNSKPAAALNPTAIVEVLSESTREYDRGEKWRNYQTIESLKDYVMVWQDRPWVEHYSRVSDVDWNYRLIDGLDKSVSLSCILVELPLAAIFRDLNLPPTSELRTVSIEVSKDAHGNS